MEKKTFFMEKKTLKKTLKKTFFMEKITEVLHKILFKKLDFVFMANEQADFRLQIVDELERVSLKVSIGHHDKR